VKKEKPFNNPFLGLKLEKKPEPSKKTPACPAPPPEPKRRTPSTEDDDAALFLASVGEVAHVRGPTRVTQKKAAPVLPPKPPPEEDDVLTQLAELTAEEGPFDVSDTEELTEGHVRGLDRRILIKLRRGDYPVEGQLDLHGQTRAEARDALERFIIKSRHESRRCVRVIHGRGLSSRDGVPVLKGAVPEWLTHGRLARFVLAFASARPEDGGAGALYVLLRR
jgi:DNA-nicking Smr family endonuclease